MKVFLTDTAKLDLIDVIDYYDSHNPAIADHFENELQKRLETLREFPQVGHIGFAGLLELGFHDFPYVLSYQVSHDQVQIIAILHTARDREQTLTIRTDIPHTHDGSMKKRWVMTQPD
jgi:toxin ParE1/3/4